MSHEATMWAVKVRGISCAEARVLWHLADCHNPIYGCYPKQDYLADACEIDERSVRRSLVALREKGLINWIEQREGKNRKANRYSLAFEQGFRPHSSENEPDNLSASSEASTGQNEGFEPDISDCLNRTQESSIEPVREPVIEPVRERGSARELSEESDTTIVEDRKKVERDFKAWYRTWPTSLADSEKAARDAWAALSREERAACIERTPAYISAVNANKGKFTFSSVYLRGKAWEKLDDPKSDVALPTVHNPFSRAWMAGMLAQLLKPAATAMPVPTKYQQLQLAQGGEAAEAVRLDRLQKYGWPRVNTMHQRAFDRQGVTVPAPLASLSESFVQVHRDAEAAKRWKEAFDRRGWPWLPNTGHEWFFFPAGEPEEALNEFAAATARERGDDAE
ncbi:helix-turn-helix domain-containing protein [Rhizobium lentis]|uniref:helix-turn-helix domain-containing protein n=1 Tax=Rhizobium lentis TaxID=1138194 RepID=UPI001C82F62D|nr:helix-turn-helix domain-containing protein [Rhizobium lentis]MBX5082150.1 helix-turn-helix domain-containing protein [Rhizobium lentis]MBX5094860.1 helix-turn-helix domain-containing protein [Rhizobium lentis]MBX5119585.1 helix-turn-helix domain-containing protein [Rhizobium lentis]